MTNAYVPSFQEETAKLEQSRVKFILREFGLQDWLGGVLDAQKHITGQKRLGFVGFDQLFPGFPICLEVQPFYRLVEHGTCSQTALFRDFRRYIPYERFGEVLDCVGERAGGRPVGAIFRWQGINHGLIIHNGDFPTKDFKQVFPWGKRHLTVEHFDRFVRTLAASAWNLDSLRSPQDVKNISSEPCKALTPWELARLVTGATELRLLAFLVEVLHYMPPNQSQQYIVRRDGERWVAVNQAYLAEQLHTSVRTVQRAVAALKSNGLIETRPNDYLENDMKLCPKVFT
ncbi:MAG: HTH domain-containing protein [Planctomycetota bacterium]